MAEITILSATARTVEGAWIDGRPVVPATALPAAIDWELKPEGLCQGDLCVPVRDTAGIDAGDGQVDLLGIASALDRPTVADADAGLVAVGERRDDRSMALRDRRAPDFSLPDLDGVPQTLGGWTGKKRLLVAFSTW